MVTALCFALACEADLAQSDVGGVAAARRGASEDDAARESSDRPPNVIFVVLDTLRADHLELYGYPESTAPNLARVGEESAVFTRAFSSSSWTAPATASLFTGLYPTRHGVQMGFLAKLRREAERESQTAIRVDQLPASVATLPEHLKRQGYRTYGIATNINIAAPIGFDRGFDRFLNLTNEPAEEVLKALRSWRAEIQGDLPYFLYLHLDDVHKPYTRRAPWFVETGDPRADAVAAYDSELHYVDAVLAQILELFGFGPGVGSESNSEPNSERDSKPDSDRVLEPDKAGGILLIASDHGEEFWDHGDDGHRFSLHYEVNRIVLMMSGPGIRPGLRTENVSGVDLLPTLLELIDAPVPERVDGRSLVPLLRGGEGATALRADLAQRALLAHRVNRHSADRQLWAVVRGPWRLIVTPEGNQLYDLRSDTEEVHDLSAREPDTVAALRSELARFQRATPVEAVAEATVLLDPLGVQQLRKLGYVEDEDDAR